MEIDIWVISDNKEEMLEAQHRINASGSMRAICILSKAALEKLLFSRQKIPSLIIVDYEMSKKEEFAVWAWLKEQQLLAGIPMFFMTNSKDGSIRDECYRLGTLGILEKPFSEVSIERIEHMAWQFHAAKNAEKKLEKQAMDLKAAREIERLNKQLKARNELLSQVFGRYFSDEIVERIFEDPSSVSLGGEKKNMTVMISDLRGFTAISQKMESDAMMDLLNYYFGKMVEAIRRYKGTVIEFMGDGVLAVFGAPITMENHTENAVAAAIMMQNAMYEVNQFCEEKGYESLSMGIGIHSGMAFIGNIGSDTVMRYNVLGRVVNECSRIEGYTVGGQILVSETAINKMKCDYETKQTLEVKAKGVERPMRVYDVIKVNGQCLIGATNGKESVSGELQKEICLEIYPVVDKLIREDYMLAKAKEVRSKSAIVVMENDREPELYGDVKICGRDMNQMLLFDDVYAKVVEERNHEFTLHFTHRSDSFHQFIENMKQ